jgi:hypothetical protein
MAREIRCDKIRENIFHSTGRRQALARHEAGTSIRIDVQARDPVRYPALGHAQTANRGRYHVHSGGQFDSSVTF